jgi:hypothetical protein
MRNILFILVVSLVTCALSAAENWPPRVEDGIVADVYPSRDLALRAVRAKLGDDAKIVEAQDRIVAAAKADATRELTVSFVDKPWAADWSAYTNRTRENVLAGRSASPCTSAAEAESAARRSAAAALLPLVRQQLTQEYSGRRVLNDAVLTEMIESNLRSRELIRDRFTQRYTRPYGDVYFATVMVDASQPTVNAIVRDSMQQAERRIQRGVGIVLAFLLLLAITTIGYVLLNWLTKGYFIWRLRFAAMMMLALGAITALAIA